MRGLLALCACVVWACAFESGSIHAASAPAVYIIKGTSLQPLVNPGDKWRLTKANRPAAYRIQVNGHCLRNSAGDPYLIPVAKARVLRLYADKYSIIPDDTYLLLGNRRGGTLDSTRFGLVHKRQIIGRAVLLDDGRE